MDKSHKLQSLKRIINQKQRIHRQKSKQNLDESIGTTQHNITAIEEKSKNIHVQRPESDVSFPRIPVLRKKYKIRNEKSGILKSHRGKNQNLQKLEQSRTNDNILLLNQIHMKVCFSF